MKKKSDNYSPFLKPKLEKLMISTPNLMNSQEKVSVMMSKLDSLDKKSKSKEEKAQPTKIQLKNLSTFWLKR